MRLSPCRANFYCYLVGTPVTGRGAQTGKVIHVISLDRRSGKGAFSVVTA